MLHNWYTKGLSIEWDEYIKSQDGIYKIEIFPSFLTLYIIRTTNPEPYGQDESPNMHFEKS